MTLAILLLLLPLASSKISDVATIGKKETTRMIHEATGEKGARDGRRSLGRSRFNRRSNVQGRGGQARSAGTLSVNFNISLPVQLGGQITISCNGNKALGLCLFKPPYAKRAQIFTPTTQIEGGRIRMSERSGGDARICEILVDKVERKDFGRWGCVIKCTCGTAKGNFFTVSETPEVNIPVPEKDESETPVVNIPVPEKDDSETPEVNIPAPEKDEPETPEVNIPVPEKDESGEYNCQEDGVNYMHRKFPNHPDIKTDTWQECQKKCAATEHCKFFTWHKRSNRYKNDCALSQTYGWKKKDSTVSGPRECSKEEADTGDADGDGPGDADIDEKKGCMIEKNIDYRANNKGARAKVETQEACANGGGG